MDGLPKGAFVVFLDVLLEFQVDEECAVAEDW